MFDKVRNITHEIKWSYSIALILCGIYVSYLRFPEGIDALSFLFIVFFILYYIATNFYYLIRRNG